MRPIVCVYENYSSKVSASTASSSSTVSSTTSSFSISEIESSKSTCLELLSSKASSGVAFTTSLSLFPVPFASLIASPLVCATKMSSALASVVKKVFL